ncbi:MAG: DNA polymerase I [Desulfobacterales bacterium]|nr:DNA polymerase I [Desulfobacterales bacterium]
MNTNPPFYLIDGSAYIYRAYHAIRSLTNSKGLPTNAAFGFARMILKLMEERSPVYMAICFDVKGPTFRHQRYADYKANRPPMPEDLAVQIPWVKKIVEGLRIPVVEQSGYEADDLIGTLALQAQAAGFSVVMVTGDKDFHQLVTDRATVYDPMKEKVFDMAEIREIYGVEPAQLIDVMGLSGDSADNIPGVPGIGPKTALDLIHTFGSMDTLFQRLEEIRSPKQREKLAANKDLALLSRELVTIDTAAPAVFDAEAFKLPAPDRNGLGTLFGELEFRQLQRAFPPVQDLSGKNYRAVLNPGDLDELIGRLRAARRFALDTETTAINPMRARLVGLSFAVAPHEAWYVPCGHDPLVVAGQLPLETVIDRLKPVLEDPALEKIGQNIKYDWIVLARHGVSLAGVTRDTMLASYLISPAKRAHGLDQIALDYLDHQTIKYQDVTGKGRDAVTFDQVPMEKAVPYACEDADLTLMAHDILMPLLEERGLDNLFASVEMPLVPVLMAMEMAGIAVDSDRLRALSKSFEAQLETIEAQIYTLAGETFNIKSSQQMGHILFEKLGLPVQKKTKKKTGYSTDVDVLTALADQHELPALVLRHRTLAKLKSTYTDALLDLVHPDTGRIHTSFNQTVTATGRLSSSDPNLQNIPVRTEEGRQIRGAFVPRPGWILMSADYSQIELRILAHCSEDPLFMDAFEKGEDIHARTAAEVFEVFPSFVDAELRRQAKAINFGIVYGMSAFGLSRQLNISRKMAQTYIDHYFARYAGVKAYMDRAIADAARLKQTSTLLGRIRPLPDIDSTNRTVRQFAERIAINTPIQGTAADLIKLAMIRVAEGLARNHLRSVMLLSVHDEILFEVPPEEEDRVRLLVTQVMEGVWDLKVPLKVNIDTGPTWADAH